MRRWIFGPLVVVSVNAVAVQISGGVGEKTYVGIEVDNSGSSVLRAEDHGLVRRELPDKATPKLSKQLPGVDVPSQSVRTAEQGSLVEGPTGGFDEAEAAHYWGKDLDPKKFSSHCMAEAIKAFADKEGYQSVADYGAGLGGFALFLQSRGFPYVYCYDANPIIFNASKGLCRVVDLSKVQPSLPKVDLAMSLEVGEHVPKEFEQNFLDNLVSAGRKAVVVSWAHPGQGGTRHVNEQPSWYIADQLRQRGYDLDWGATGAMRTQSSQCPQWYFWQNAMVFKKREGEKVHWYDTWSDWIFLSVQNFRALLWFKTQATE